MDIEGCHRLPLGRNMTNTMKRVIVKFVTKNILKLCFNEKKTLILHIRFL